MSSLDLSESCIDKNIEKRMLACYSNAIDYLVEISPPELRGNELEKYFNVEKELKTKNNLLYALLVSLQNNQMMPNVIGLENGKRKEKFKAIFNDYDAEEVLKNYTADSLFEKFCDTFTVSNKESKNNLWRRYSKSVISAAKFISQFKCGADFKSFISQFSHNHLSSAALPLILEKEVYGLGFPLACDFLKEIGYTQYPKPDVHIKGIFHAFGFCEDDDYEAYKAVIKMANLCGETPYKVDKVFWLIASGKFYLHDKEIGSHKKAFIDKFQQNFHENNREI